MSIIDLDYSRKRMNDGRNYTMSLVSCECHNHVGERKRLIRKNYGGRTYGHSICMKCKDRHYTGENNKNKGRPVSHKEKLRLKTLNIGRKANEETKRKMSLAHSGEKNHMYGKPGTWLGKKRPEHAKKLSGANNYNWNPNITDEERLHRRGSPEDIQWSLKVKENDGWKCQCCGRKGYLEAHHLYNYADFPDKKHDTKNGKALCKRCHRNFHAVWGKKKNTPEQFYKWLSHDYQI